MHLFQSLINLVSRYFQTYFGFIRGHSYLSVSDIECLKKLVDTQDSSIVEEFEKSFSLLIGKGSSVSFATGRMGFYALLKLLNVGKGDEVIILGHTCSVMPNAVFRSGAKPIYSDIDPETLGSSAEEIKKVITSNTKLVVAQHSFGIPCRIKAIAKICKKEGIFLLEDCALTLGSKISEVTVGNFGDAALFSTDHSKPLNTITGGLIYSQDKKIFKSLKNIQKESKSLSKEVKFAIWKNFIEEIKYCNPDNYGKSFLIKALLNFFFKNYSSEKEFLNEDFGRTPSKSYPYPARLPSFLASLGLKEIERWDEDKKRKKELLSKYLNLMEALNLIKMVPKAYFSKEMDIIPLRFVILHPEAHKLRKVLDSYIPTNWFWFTQPVQECESGDPKDLGYSIGSCKNSEKVNELVINLPCLFNSSYDDIFFSKTSYFLKDSIRN